LLVIFFYLPLEYIFKNLMFCSSYRDDAGDFGRTSTGRNVIPSGQGRMLLEIPGAVGRVHATGCDKLLPVELSKRRMSDQVSHGYLEKWNSNSLEPMRILSPFFREVA
jgi:hypothetical protein